ncbi:hypothetical protein F5H01DRAFT_351997 [Linnemannia elongata]|nr:hypothetical protein F5H01DRAFT_351997 [Linnemannia elongata]
MCPILPPEIQIIVAQNLRHQDLSRAVLLNKAWYSSCNPQLYHTVRLSTPFQRQRFLSLSVSKDVIIRHVPHIKYLMTRSLEILPLLMRLDNTSGLSLIGLEILALRTRRSLTSEEDDLLLAFLKRNPQLLHLNIRRVSENAGAYLSTIAKYLPNLRTLSMFDVLGLSPPLVLRDAAVRFLNTCSADLEQLVVAWEILSYDEVAIDQNDVDDDDEAQDSLKSKTHPALRFLSARVNSNSVLASFVEGCPRLEAVIHPEFQNRQVNTLFQHSSLLHLALQKITGVRYMELSVPAAVSNDSTIASLISTINNSQDGVQQKWRTIGIEGSAYGGGPDETIKAIVNNCAHGLVHLHIPQGWQLMSRDLHSILCTATDLRVFNVVHLPRISAAYVISSPWGCRWLTKLSVQITNIPRPDILIDRKGCIRSRGERAAEGTMEASRAMQRKVYRQLGALTCLEFLALGLDSANGTREELVDDIDGTIYDPEFQLNCLEMSLASGLDLLGGLSRLRYLRVVGMEHRIGVPELQWMMVHFPRLERLKGIDPEVCYLPLILRPTREYQPEPGVRQWLSSQATSWVS